MRMCPDGATEADCVNSCSGWSTLKKIVFDANDFVRYLEGCKCDKTVVF